MLGWVVSSQWKLTFDVILIFHKKEMIRKYEATQWTITWHPVTSLTYSCLTEGHRTVTTDNERTNSPHTSFTSRDLQIRKWPTRYVHHILYPNWPYCVTWYALSVLHAFIYSFNTLISSVNGDILLSLGISPHLFHYRAVVVTPISRVWEYSLYNTNICINITLASACVLVVHTSGCSSRRVSPSLSLFLCLWMVSFLCFLSSLAAQWNDVESSHAVLYRELPSLWGNHYFGPSELCLSFSARL